MINRSSIFFLPILIIIFAIYAFFSRPPICSDPAGCIWIGVNDPIDIGIGVVTTGVDRSLSVEIQRSLDLFANNLATQPADHKLNVKTYFSSCLPDVLVQSTVDLSADRHVLAVIGPTCGENTADFKERMVDANKITISPIPYRSTSNEAAISINPNINQLATQTTDWIRRLGYSRIIILYDTDEQSLTFSTGMCDHFRAAGTCTVDVAGSSNFQPETYDAVVEVFLNESNPPNQDALFSNTNLPQIIVSFSRPVITSDPSPTLYWISPQFWNENKDFSETYFSTYKSYPTSFASGVLYSRLPMIYNMIRETAVTAWDGSWIVPLGKLKQRLDLAFANDSYFCSSTSINCPPFTLVAYQVAGNEYKLVNP